jgi:threonine aldolase
VIRFSSDYTEGAHPRVLDKLVATNMEQTAGYGTDPYCLEAARLIKERCSAPGADVHFFVGGTQTNLTVISAALRPHQGAIAAVTGHINTHESGAIEATGHKVLAVPSPDGKLTSAMIQALVDAHESDENHEHTVQPKLVYISNSTEIGTVYTKAELAAISETCRKNGLFLYMDGARLGAALCSDGSDLDLVTIARLCDVFYIGGTKNGALFGEALVITSEALKPDFRYILKQKGGMLAKGRLLGLQFIALFEGDLYFEMARHAGALAMTIRDACREKGYPFLIDSPSNQQFPILPDDVMAKLREKYAFELWQKVDGGHTAVRFATSWATKQEDVEQLCTDLLES